MAKIIPNSRNKADRSGKSSDQAPAPRGAYFTADDGTQIYYEDTGGQGTPIFFVYGLGCTVQHFKYARQWFASPSARAGGYRQVWIDYRGQGNSERSPTGLRLSLRRIADDIGGLCAHLDLQQTVLWGQSLGGLIAMRVAERYPERVGALVIQGTPIGDPSDQFPAPQLTKKVWSAFIELNQFSNAPMRWLYHGFSKVRATDRWRNMKSMHTVWRELIRHNGFSPDLAKTHDIEDYIRSIGDVPFDLFFDLAFDLEQFSVPKVAPQVSMPALVIAGRNDQLVPVEDAQTLAELLPQGELWVVEHGSHCPHFDDPTLVHRRVLAFLAVCGLSGGLGSV